MASVNGDAGTSAPLFPDRKSGVWGQTDTGYGVAGTSNSGNGVQGGSIKGFGAVGTSAQSTGVIGISGNETGVYGRSDKESSESVPGGIGVNGQADGQRGIGVKGTSINGTGVYGRSEKKGSFVESGGAGVKGENILDFGVGVNGQADGQFGEGVRGEANGTNGAGVKGKGISFGVVGSSSSTGVKGESEFGLGIFGLGGNIGVFALNNAKGDGVTNPNSAYLASRCCAGDFYGNVAVHGQLQLIKPSQAFKIDHPLDPANKYLSHSFVQSPDMKNVYDGVVVIDAEGKAVVQLPDWFEALNENFCYQLTSIGAAGPNLYIAEEINNNCFTIAGGVQGMKVSWQVTGTRKDAAANEANQIMVEEEKPENERGYYLHPSLYNELAEKGIKWARYPEQMKLLEDERNRLKDISEYKEKGEGSC